MTRYYKPKWLYESLPYLYTATGAAVLVTGTVPLVLASGGLLVLAGIYVWTIRKIDRRRVKAERLMRNKKRSKTKYTDWGDAR